MLTFNPGWDANAKAFDSFTDVRYLQKKLTAQGQQVENEADESTTGLASMLVVDPDGHPVLVDLHV